jgi:hypothetical protein
VDRRIFIVLLVVLAVAGCGKKNDPGDADCGALFGRERNDCIYNKSVALNNAAMCKDMANETWRANCITSIAVRRQVDFDCMNIERLSLREDCERKVARAMQAQKKAGAKTGTT